MQVMTYNGDLAVDNQHVYVFENLISSAVVNMYKWDYNGNYIWSKYIIKCKPEYANLVYRKGISYSIKTSGSKCTLCQYTNY